MTDNKYWLCIVTDKKANRRSLTKEFVIEHPLKPGQSPTKLDELTRNTRPKSDSNGLPLVKNAAAHLESLSQALEGLDPLTAFSLQESDQLLNKNDEFKNDETDSASKTSIGELWEQRKTKIFENYLTNEKSGFYGRTSCIGNKTYKVQHVDKVLHRLEQITALEESKQTKESNTGDPNEFITRIEKMNQDITTAWNSEQKVKALKISIQCAKMLSETEGLRFYPSKFVLVTNVLDNFGELVYSRLSAKAENMQSQLYEASNSASLYTDTAKETCLNWFYKIASIRELVPRLYIEMALIKIYTFISLSDCSDALLRLINIINGVGNQLVAIYARCYLSKVAAKLLVPNVARTVMINNVNCFISVYKQLSTRYLKTELSKQQLSYSTYMTLFSPALDYMLECCVRLSPASSNEQLLTDMVQKCHAQAHCSFVINSIMRSFSPDLISRRCTNFLEIIGHSVDQGIPLYVHLKSLGNCLSSSPPSANIQRQIFTKAWDYIDTINSCTNYTTCVRAWIPFIVQNFELPEIELAIKDILRHVKSCENYSSNICDNLKSIIEQIVEHATDLTQFLSMNAFLQCVELLRDDYAKMNVCKFILSHHISTTEISDPIVINSLMYLCKLMHDSVSALTPDDELRQIGDILCSVIKSVSYGSDLEQQLNFFVETRGSFPSVDSVLYHLVQSVIQLSMDSRKFYTNSTRKSMEFVQACAAYCFITIPSIKSAKTQLQLYILSGQVALYNECLGQADDSFLAAISIIKGTSDESLLPYIRQLMSLLIMVPDNPNNGQLHLVKRLLNAIRRMCLNQKWQQYVLFIDCLDMLSVMAQPVYPYRANQVECNDVQYGSDPVFITEINQICYIILIEILTELTEHTNGQRHSHIALELLNRILLRSFLNESMSMVIQNLWKNAAKYTDAKLMARTKQYFGILAKRRNDEKLQNLIEKLNKKN